MVLAALSLLIGLFLCNISVGNELATLLPSGGLFALAPLVFDLLAKVARHAGGR
jgi:hypothetical protein